ncbi:MAG: ArsR/SmtB family transcription factor [Candidatus Methanodesulfokora sp.]|jgi:DNA-binding transcriptional ArsR family regulator
MEEVFHIEDDRLSTLASVLSSETGRTILLALSNGPKSAGDISESTGLPISTVMFHLSKLVESGFVKIAGDIPGKHGRKKLYELTSNRLIITIAPRVERDVSKKEKAERTRIFDYAKPVMLSLMIALLMSGIFLYGFSNVFAPKNELIRAPTALSVPSEGNVTPLALKGNTTSLYEAMVRLFYIYVIIFAIIIALTSSLISTWISRGYKR